jgi:hypothetical protein
MSHTTPSAGSRLPGCAGGPSSRQSDWHRRLDGRERSRDGVRRAAAQHYNDYSEDRVATGLRRGISSFGVRALKGCPIKLSSYAKNQTWSSNLAFAACSAVISVATSSIADITEPVAV